MDKRGSEDLFRRILFLKIYRQDNRGRNV